ncbi:hypothetical protein A3766_25390 [Oleiphilus sp. HI0132]|uniref:alpha/beta fold hydrolase n=1 Tax=Oleiphilus sp. HI0132 TaxID=1822270 RepID=UPI0007C2AAE1|nr:alpha/beta hydrolase [Oleiphilus sp. HI0132]KZZ79754.1 hypothetical protein A3766_25390 [Oleiphilus sp. HI0132]
MKLVFIHGSGMNSVVWEQQLVHFSHSEAVDLPGHPNGPKLKTMEDYVQSVGTYLDTLDDVILVGHSLGSAVVLALAAQGHRSLKGMVLIGAGARSKVLPTLLDKLTDLFAKGDDRIPESVLAMNHRIDEPLRSKINAAMQENGAGVLLRDLQACNGFDLMNELASIDLPSLIIVGDQDIMTPPKYADYLKKALANASLALIPGGSHMVFAEQADEVNARIDSFINTL